MKLGTVLASMVGLAAMAALAGFPRASDADPSTWAFPENPAPAPAQGWDRSRLIAMHGYAPKFTEAQTRDRFHAVDWRPKGHPAMPDVVASGRRPAVYACGFCHLPAGEGRPENASLAGLPHDYIVSQVRAFAKGERSSVVKGWAPSALMASLSGDVTPAEAEAAASYFSKLRFTSHVRVVETAKVGPPRATNYLLTPVAGAPLEPLGLRIVESAASMEGFEHRDPLMTYVAYVPVGSLKRGAALAGGAGGVQPCAECHGEALNGGWLGPPLAGRSPSYLFRQLLAFKTGSRSGADAAGMQAETARLTTADMIALAAYAGSIRH